MTSNMINYRKLEEDRRHNREMERLTGEQQAEVARHNVAVEDETRRTNIANEQIKSQQNVINANHYGKTDFEAARHNSIVEYYQYQLPNAKGQTDANVAKTWSEAGLNKAKKGEAEASTAEKYSKVAVNETQADLNKAKANESFVQFSNILADIDLKKAQQAKVLREAEVADWKSVLYPYESVSQIYKNISSSFKFYKMGD